MSLETVHANNGHARIQYIDTMKAWAILCVVMGHILIFNLFMAINIGFKRVMDYFLNSAFSIKGYHYVVSISGVIFFTSLLYTIQ